MAMDRTRYDRVLAALTDRREPLLIACHVGPDGDAVGAALAVAQYCELIGRPCELVNDDSVPSRYGFLPGAARFRRTEDVRERFRCAVAVDCADFRRLGEVPSLFAEPCELVNIDHHETNNGYGAIALVEPEASATCLVLYRLFRAGDVPIGKTMALYLYTGIVFDTGGFRYSNTTPEIHHVAADLLMRGIEPFVVADQVLEAMTREQAELVRLALSTLTVDASGRIAHIVIRAEMLKASGADETDTEVLLPYTRSLSGVEVGILSRERPDGSVKVSLRSRDVVDVAAIALRFGGGGHVRAAGCQLDGPVEKAVARLLAAVEQAVRDAFAPSVQPAYAADVPADSSIR